jgi:hypothetical protein
MKKNWIPAKIPKMTNITKASEVPPGVKGIFGGVSSALNEGIEKKANAAR